MQQQILRFVVTMLIIFFTTSCAMSTDTSIEKGDQVEESSTNWPSTGTIGSTPSPNKTIATPTTNPNPTKVAPTLSANKSTTTPVPSPTNDLTSTLPSPFVDGLLTYQSDFYDYEIHYPQDAHLDIKGVSGFPTEEQPEDMTFQQYLTQLRQKYPEDICVQIHYKNGFVAILAPPENGGKYGDVCPSLGIGAYDLVEQSETIIVDGSTYLATGFTIHEQNETAVWQGEFLSFRLDDRTLITMGSDFNGQPSYEAYKNTKEILLQIITSYHKNE